MQTRRWRTVAWLAALHIIDFHVGRALFTNARPAAQWYKRGAFQNGASGAPERNCVPARTPLYTARYASRTVCPRKIGYLEVT